MSDEKIEFWSKMLPDQPEHNNQFTGDDYIPALYKTICHSSGIESPHERLKLEQSDLFTVEEMASNPVTLRYFQFLIRTAGVRRVLEIGAFIGVSTIYFAEAVPADGEVVSIEKFSTFAEIAQKNFVANGVDDKITLLNGDANDIIATLPKDEKFDLVFVDGNKERYLDYVLMVEPLLSERGIIIVDDCFFHGDAVNETPTSEKGAGTKAFLDWAANQSDWHRIALPLANGVFMMTRA